MTDKLLTQRIRQLNFLEFDGVTTHVNTQTNYLWLHIGDVNFVSTNVITHK